MESIRVVFVRAKAWQIFLLLFATPLIAVFGEFANSMRFSIAIMVVYAFAAVGWYWSLGSFLSSIVKPELRRSTTFFSIAALYPVMYMSVCLWLLMKSQARVEIILPLHLFAMFCMFFLLYFVASTLTVVEIGRPASFSDYAGSLLLLWFYPIGIWVIQPKVNRLYESTSGHQLPVME